MSWRDALDLTSRLAADPTSHVAASLQGWSHPVSREWLALRLIHDRFVQTKFKKPYPLMPAPWDVPEKRSIGTPVSRERLHALLDAHREGGGPDVVVEVI